LPRSSLSPAGSSSSGPAGPSAPPVTAVAAPAASTAAAPPLDGGSYGTAAEIESVLSMNGQKCAPGATPSLLEFDGASDAAMCSSPDAASQDTTIVVFGNHDQASSYATGIVVAVAGLPANTTAVLGVNWALSTSSPTYGQAAQHVLGGTIESPQDAPSPSVAASQAPEQVTYACSGHGGVTSPTGPTAPSTPRTSCRSRTPTR